MVERDTQPAQIHQAPAAAPAGGHQQLLGQQAATLNNIPRRGRQQQGQCPGQLGGAHLSVLPGAVAAL